MAAISNMTVSAFAASSYRVPELLRGNVPERILKVGDSTIISHPDMFNKCSISAYLSSHGWLIASFVELPWFV